MDHLACSSPDLGQEWCRIGDATNEQDRRLGGIDRLTGLVREERFQMIVGQLTKEEMLPRLEA